MKVRPDGKGVVIDVEKVRQREVQRLNELGHDAQLKLDSLREREAAGPIKPNDPTYRPKEAARWAVDQLHKCSNDKHPPPSSLVELVAHLLDVDRYKLDVDRYKSDIRRELDLHTTAVMVANNPDVSNAAIASLIGRNVKTIRKWRSENEFKYRVKMLKL